MSVAWHSGQNPVLTRPDGKRIALEVVGDVPYLLDEASGEPALPSSSSSSGQALAESSSSSSSGSGRRFPAPGEASEPARAPEGVVLGHELGPNAPGHGTPFLHTEPNKENP